MGTGRTCRVHPGPYYPLVYILQLWNGEGKWCWSSKFQIGQLWMATYLADNVRMVRGINSYARVQHARTALAQTSGCTNFLTKQTSQLYLHFVEGKTIRYLAFGENSGGRRLSNSGFWKPFRLAIAMLFQPATKCKYKTVCLCRCESELAVLCIDVTTLR